MKSIYFATLLTFTTWMTGVTANVIGPFGLYTKSSDPNWDMRYISLGVRTGYNSISDSPISDPSQIPQSSVNYFINSTGTDELYSDTGNLVWPSQTYGEIRYPTYYVGIQVFDPTSPLQPTFGEGDRRTDDYTAKWSFNNGQVFLNGVSQFYGQMLHAPFWNSDALFWNFGGDGAQIPANASAVTLWKYP